MKVEKFTRWVPQRSGSDCWVFSFYSWQSLFCGCQLVPTFGALTPIYWIYWLHPDLCCFDEFFGSSWQTKTRGTVSESLDWVIHSTHHTLPEKPVVHPYKLVGTWLRVAPCTIFLIQRGQHLDLEGIIRRGHVCAKTSLKLVPRPALLGLSLKHVQPDPKLAAKSSKATRVEPPNDR